MTEICVETKERLDQIYLQIYKEQIKYHPELYEKSRA